MAPAKRSQTTTDSIASSQTPSSSNRWLVGLTGGIGSGKSAAAQRFADHGIDIVDADLASRAVVEPGEPALTKIADHFGHSILQSDGTLDRTKLRHTVFADEQQRRWLQGLLHPLIRQYIRTNIELASSDYVMLVNPLLIESRQNIWCDRVVIIDVPVEIQIDRTMARDDNTREQVEAIIKAQVGREMRQAAADDIIDNGNSLSELHEQVDEHHQKYLKLCQTHPES